MEVICPICFNEAKLRLTKKHHDYYQCSNCNTIFTDYIDQDGMVGGEFEVERNTKQNHLRVERINQILEGVINEDTFILDFGCGTGYFIEDLKKAGYPNVEGYDPYTENFWRLPGKNKYMLVNMTEVIEHTATQFKELDLIYQSLKPGGAVLIETGTIDGAIADGHTIDTYFYINPAAGHSTIFSIHGLDLLMALKGFYPKQKYNNYVHLYQKPF